MSELNSNNNRNGCLAGCLWTFLGLAIVAVILVTVVIKVVLPKVTADFLVTQSKDFTRDGKGWTSKDLDTMIKTIDGIDEKKIKPLLDELDRRPITNSRETLNLVLNRLGVEGVDNAQRAEIASNLSPADISNMFVAYRKNPAASSMSMGVLKGLVHDTLVEMKKRTDMKGK